MSMYLQTANVCTVHVFYTTCSKAQEPPLPAYDGQDLSPGCVFLDHEILSNCECIYACANYI